MADAAFLRRRVRPPSERSACDNAPPTWAYVLAAAGVDITASNKGRGQGCPVSGSRWPEENERCQRSLEQLSSWTLAQDTDKPKFAEHYHGSTDITFPEGTHQREVHARQHAPAATSRRVCVVVVYSRRSGGRQEREEGGAAS